MTAWEMVDGKYYEQYSEEYYAALEELMQPKFGLEHIIAREIKRLGSEESHYSVPAILVRAAPSHSE